MPLHRVPGKTSTASWQDWDLRPSDFLRGRTQLGLWLFEPFLFQHLRYVFSIHKYIGDGTAVDILAMGHDTDRSFFEKLLQPLSGFWSAWLVQFRRVDAA